MYNHRQESFRTKETPIRQFFNSCLGKIVLFIGFIIILLFFAFMSKPSKGEMLIMINDGVHTCIVANNESKQDDLDDAARNFGAIFTGPSVTPDDPSMKEFYRYNRIEIYDHPLYMTAYIFNNAKPSGTRVGFGFFGIVLPTVTYDDYVSHLGPIHKGYNRKLISNDNWSDDNQSSDNGKGSKDNSQDDDGGQTVSE
jgi:hypothetical protein